MPPMLRLILPALLLLGAPAARAQVTDRAWAVCDNLSGDETPARVIAACGGIIADRNSPPDSLAAAYRDRGLAYRASGDPAKAVADLDAAIRLSPRDADLFYARGNTFAAQRDFTRAITDYDEAIKLDPDNAQAFNNRGGAYHNQKNFTRALADFDKALELAPDYPAALSNRCAARAALNQDLDKAQADCALSLRLRPGHVPTLDTRGLVGLLRHDYAGAKADYEAVLREEPREFSAVYGRGLAQIGLGQAEQGRADIAAANAGDPTAASYYASLGLKP